MMWLTKKNLFVALVSLLIFSSIQANTSQHLKWMAVKNMPPGVQIAILKGDPYKPGPFIARLKLPPHYVMPAHSHDSNTEATVISGTYYIGTGNVADANKGTPIHPGQVVNFPANSKHYGWTKDGAILQINGIGPWEMIYNKNG